MKETQPYTATFDSDKGYQIKTPHGYLDATFDAEARIFNIGYVFVHSKRGLGFGRQLVTYALQEAIELGAERVTAKLVSREAVDTSRSVFGEEAVRVEFLGQYGQDQRPPHLRTGTLGWLDYAVEQAEVL